MRWNFTYWIERLMRDPRVRERMLSTLDALGQKPWHATSGRRPDVVIDHPGPGQTWHIAGAASRPASARTRMMVWMAGGAALLLWILLVFGAYGLWFMFGDWLILQATSLGRASSMPLGMAESVASALYFLRDMGGPLLMVLGAVVSAVIVVLTALSARLLGAPARR
jgi:hypothetical protein